MASPSHTEIQETLTQLQDWEDRYAYIIDLGKLLPTYPDAFKSDGFLVPGCTSRVWLHTTWDQDVLNINLDSDAVIVRGLIAIIYSLYNGKARADITQIDLESYFKSLGLEAHLSPNRRNGFFAVATRIKNLGSA